MNKISIEEVESVLLNQKITPDKVSTIIKQLEEVIEEGKTEKVSTPKQKNEFVIILSDPTEEIKTTELSGWVVTIKQGENPAEVLNKIREAARDTDTAKKRKKSVMTTFGEAFQGIKRKFIKDKNINIKTKSPVQVLITNNKL